MKVRATAILAAIGFLAASVWPAAGASVAFVVRDVDYERMASRDVVDGIADSLWQHGFKVVNATPGSNREAINRILKAEFDGEVPGADVALLYYVGTALTGGDRSFVLTGSAAVANAQLDLQDLLKSLARSKNSVAILDIVRKRTNNQAAAVKPGLGAISPVTESQLLAFSTVPDDQARDGLPMTASLSRYLKRAQPKLALLQLASSVRDEVAYETGGRHVPWIAGQVSRDLELPLAGDWKQRRSEQLSSLLQRHNCADRRVTPHQAMRTFLARKGRPAPADLAEVASVDTYDMSWLLREARPGVCPEAFKAVSAPSGPSAGGGRNGGSNPPSQGRSPPSPQQRTPSSPSPSPPGPI